MIHGISRRRAPKSEPLDLYDWAGAHPVHDDQLEAPRIRFPLQIHDSVRQLFSCLLGQGRAAVHGAVDEFRAKRRVVQRSRGHRPALAEFFDVRTLCRRFRLRQFARR